MYKQNKMETKGMGGGRYLHNKEGTSMYKRKGDNAGRLPHVAKIQNLEMAAAAAFSTSVRSLQ